MSKPKVTNVSKPASSAPSAVKPKVANNSLNKTGTTASKAKPTGKIKNVPITAWNNPNTVANLPGNKITSSSSGNNLPINMTFGVKSTTVNKGVSTASSLLSLSDIVSGKNGKFNPPPHKSSRSIPPSAFANMSTSSVRSADTVAIRTAQTANKRGFMFQDLDMAMNANGTPKGKANLWGFQFMYNPTTISYSNSQMSGVDYTNIQDVGVSLFGTQSVSFSLLLNRVVDMSALRKNVTTTPMGATTSGTSSYYGKTLSLEDVTGILDRGTEYDLEFLYRVLNGDPASGPTMNMPTSDFGYISGTPIWIRFHDNLRYKGSVNNISVNHTLFTEDMVPMMSEVTITFLRIPSPIYSDQYSATTDWFTKRYQNTTPLMAQSLQGTQSTGS